MKQFTQLDDWMHLRGIHPLLWSTYIPRLLEKRRAAFSLPITNLVPPIVYHEGKNTPIVIVNENQHRYHRLPYISGIDWERLR